MRSIVMFNRVSADGQFASADGGLDWVVPEPAIDRIGVAGMPETDTVLFGRKTYEQFASFWPHVLSNSEEAPNPHGPGSSKEMRAMAEWLNHANKLVFSRTLKHATWNNSRLMGEFSARQVEALKKQPGKNIIIFGSGSIVSQLSTHGLIDEYVLVMCPLFLGNGRPLLSDISKQIQLELSESKSFPSGTMLLRYKRAK